MTNIDFQLEGRFRFDVFKQDGSLSYSTEYYPNFITSTGLNYIKTFALADCFRYISVGTGTGVNSLIGNGTTGLSIPISGYQYIGGNPNASDNCSRGNQYIEGACGYRVEKTGFSLFRGWRIPAESGVYFDRDYILNEFMVTPGPNKVMGYRYGGLSGACACIQQVYIDSSEVGEVRQGNEASDFFVNYPTICDSDKAFARAVRRIPVKSGEFLVAHYSLFISANTGITSFRFTGGRGTGVYNGENNDGVYNWSGISGRYSLIHYGFKPINDGSVQSIGAAQQINASYRFRLGESFIPYYGIPFEPSCPITNRIGYLTSDNVQFFANPFGGAMTNTGQYFPFNPLGEPFPSGVIYFLPNLFSDYSNDNHLNPNGSYVVYQRLINARRSSSSWTRPATGDFRSTASFTVEEVPSTEVSGSGVILPDTGRNRSLSLVYKYDDENLTGLKVSRAHIQAYKHTSLATQYYPFVDMVFSPQDTYGNFVKEPIPALDYTSGIRFNFFNLITGVDDFPTMSAEVGSPYPTIYPSFGKQTVSGDSTYTFYGLFYSPVERPTPHKVVLAQDTGGGQLIDSLLHGAGGDVNSVKTYCYATPMYNSGFISGLNWIGTGFPSEAVELISTSVKQSFGGGGLSEIYWGKVDTFVISKDVVYPQWLLTGENCIFCTGRWNGTTNFLAKVLVQNSPTLGNWIYVHTKFSNYTTASFSPNILTSYKAPSGVLLTGTTGGYSFIDWNNQLAMKFNINWSSPCLSGVLGC
jgi:hypothetical protein